jgi:hypothetical protein
MPSDIIAFPPADVEVLKQWLDALVVTVEAAEEKAATARCRVLSGSSPGGAGHRQEAGPRIHVFLDHGDRNRFFIVRRHHLANLHIQADTMMEEIHLDTSGPAVALMTFYSNKTLSAPPSPHLAPPRPLGKNNGSGPGNSNGSNNNRHRNNNHRNGGSGGKNNDNGGNNGCNTSSNTTVVSHGATTSDGQGPPPWPTYVNPSQGHIAMYPGPSPTGQQRL